MGTSWSGHDGIHFWIPALHSVTLLSPVFFGNKNYVHTHYLPFPKMQMGDKINACKWLDADLLLSHT
jgi:hypothetical protein